MKHTIFILLCLLSLNSFSEIIIYSGSEKGSSCEVQLDLSRRFVTYAGEKICAVPATDNFSRTDKKIILEGGAQNYKCKIEVTLNEEQRPVNAVLKTKYLFKPFYTQVSRCNDLETVR